MKSALSFLIAAKRSEIAGLRRLALTGELVSAIGHLVHALQKERGLSNLYLASQGRRWVADRLQQVAASEALQRETLAAFNQLDTDSALSGHRARLFGRIAYALQGLNALPSLRERVQTQSWTTARAVAAYARVIQALLAVVFEAADTAWDPDISRHLVGYFNFLQAKEFAGQERAVGSALFASGRAEADDQLRLVHLIDSQERCLQTFDAFAGPVLQARWHDAQRPSALLALERMRRVLCTAAAGNKLDSDQSQLWFDTSTERIDAMHAVEGALAETLLALCAQRLGQAEQDLANLERHPVNRHPQAGRSAPSQGPDFFDDAAALPLALPASIAPTAPAYGTEVERSLLELVRDQASRLQAMGDELDNVRAGLNERKTIERAKGLLMAHRNLSEDEAHKTMRQMAMNQSRRLVDVAQSVLTMADAWPTRSR